MAIRAAVIQAATVFGDLDATLAKAHDLMTQASDAGAQLAVFPEAFLGGYPRGMSFGATVGSRTAQGRDEFRSYWQGAVDVPGPVVTQLGEWCRELGLCLVIGVIERDGGTLYCTALTFDADGRYCGKHRKLMPTGAERLVWGFGDGSTLDTFDVAVGRVGSVICWENYMPLLRAAMYAKGVQIYCAPTADPRDSWTATMRHIACEGRCFVLGANQFTPPTTSDTGEELPGCRGGSLIVSPMGDVLAGPCYDGEDILTAEIDLDDIARGKYDFDVVGHYARPDIFRLSVNEAPQRPVTIDGTQHIDAT